MDLNELSLCVRKRNIWAKWHQNKIRILLRHTYQCVRVYVITLSESRNQRRQLLRLLVNKNLVRIWNQSPLNRGNFITFHRGKSQNSLLRIGGKGGTWKMQVCNIANEYLQYKWDTVTVSGNGVHPQSTKNVKSVLICTKEKYEVNSRLTRHIRYLCFSFWHIQDLPQ